MKKESCDICGQNSELINMDVLEFQEMLASRLGEKESRELLRYINDRPDLVTKEYLDKSIETLARKMSAKIQSELKDFAPKMAGFPVAQAAVIVTLIKLL